MYAAVGRGQQVNDVVQHLAKAYAGDGVAAHYGHYDAVQDALPETLHGVFGRELQLLEVLLHEFFVGAGGGFHDLLAAGFDFVLHAVGDRDLFKSLAFAGERLVLQYAYDAGELAVLHDGDLDGSHVRAVLVGDGGQRLLEVGVFAGHVVDDDHAGGVVLVALFPRLLSAHVQTADRAHGDDRTFAYGQGAHHFAGKIEEAGNVDQVDFGVLILQGSQRCGN